ncbi:Hypothetical predicted protein [Podarcis lilfordi]|uniref:Uncharacterized protein n=1 Tax=Podarcis lilfordi TaxID=74358 RepID=A0AA35P8V5_9SAUR|nr:Hypothetical predicted protein [Podarcis lilfordi]
MARFCFHFRLAGNFGKRAADALKHYNTTERRALCNFFIRLLAASALSQTFTFTETSSFPRASALAALPGTRLQQQPRRRSFRLSLPRAGLATPSQPLGSLECANSGFEGCAGRNTPGREALRLAASDATAARARVSIEQP